MPLLCPFRALSSHTRPYSRSSWYPSPPALVNALGRAHPARRRMGKLICCIHGDAIRSLRDGILRVEEHANDIRRNEPPSPSQRCSSSSDQMVIDTYVILRVADAGPAAVVHVPPCSCLPFSAGSVGIDFNLTDGRASQKRAHNPSKNIPRRAAVIRRARSRRKVTHLCNAALRLPSRKMSDRSEDAAKVASEGFVRRPRLLRLS